MQWRQWCSKPKGRLSMALEIRSISHKRPKPFYQAAQCTGSRRVRTGKPETQKPRRPTHTIGAGAAHGKNRRAAGPSPEPSAPGPYSVSGRVTQLFFPPPPRSTISRYRLSPAVSRRRTYRREHAARHKPALSSTRSVSRGKKETEP
jgi:hypothetical protein